MLRKNLPWFFFTVKMLTNSGYTLYLKLAIWIRLRRWLMAQKQKILKRAHRMLLDGYLTCV